MPVLDLETMIKAPAEICFDLLRDKRVHSGTVWHIDGEAGVGQTVRFESKYPLSREIKLVVVEYDRPLRLVDEMLQGPFSSFRHEHEFSPLNDETLMKDHVVWTSRIGSVGVLADSLFVKQYLKNLVQTRNAKLKEIAEAS